MHLNWSCVNFDRSSSTQSQHPFEEWISVEQMVQNKMNGDSSARNSSFVVYRHRLDNSRKGSSIIARHNFMWRTSTDRSDRSSRFTFYVNVSGPWKWFNSFIFQLIWWPTVQRTWHMRVEPSSFILHFSLCSEHETETFHRLQYAIGYHTQQIHRLP